MVTPLVVYRPQGRLRVLARGEPLPDRTSGTALFADISGFTSLTERLTQQLGAQRGVEELARRINAVYEALSQTVEHYGGSVVSFSGDAIPAGSIKRTRSNWPWSRITSPEKI